MRLGKRTLHLNPAYAAAAAIALLVNLGLLGCSSGEKPDGPPAGGIDISAVPDAVPRVESRSRYGNAASYRVNGKRYFTLKSNRNYRKRGIASWYGGKFHGRLTSSREPYDMYAMTAAHRTLPLPTYARVTNLRNNRSVVVRINDRGPFHANRIIDLSYAAATKLGIVHEGTGLVEVTAIDPSVPKPRLSAIKPVSTTQPITPPRLYLQIGAFGSRFNAEKLQARISPTVSEAVHIHKLERNPLPLYRVRIGPLGSVQLADNLSSELQRQLGLAAMHVVVE